MLKKLSEIKPDKEQPRKTFEDESLKFLAESILSNGLITPIDIDEDGIIIDGERRWKAHKLAGLKEIEVRVVKLKKDKVQRLKRQLISDIQNDDVPTGERYEAIVRLWKMSAANNQGEFCSNLGIERGVLQSAFDYCEFAEEEPELAQQVSARVIADTKGLPKEERKELIEHFKEIPKEEKKTELMRHLVKEKKKEIQQEKEMEKLREQATSKKDIKITTDREAVYKLREEIIETQNHFDRLMSNVRWARKKKFFFEKPKQRDDFLRFLDGASQRARKWADELDNLKEEISIEILRE